MQSKYRSFYSIHDYDTVLLIWRYLQVFQTNNENNAELNSEQVWEEVKQLIWQTSYI